MAVGTIDNVLTLPDLRKVVFELKFWDQKDPAGSPTTFFAKVTEMLAFRKMQQTVVEVTRMPVLAKT